VAVDRHQFWQKVADVDSEQKRRKLSNQQLQDYQKYFVEVRFDKLLPSYELDRTATYTTLVQREIDRRLGTKTLDWARIAGITGIVAVTLAVVALAVQIWFAKAAPSKPGVASPASSLQTPATISESPAQVVDSSTATPLPQLEVTATPSATP
jgi:hypothetical protein